MKSQSLCIRDLGFSGSVGDDPVVHGFFGKQGGVSTGIYAQLNCAVGSNDSVDSITENRQRVARVLGIESANLLSLYQVHSSRCLVITDPYDVLTNRPQADAYITDRPGIALGVLTADCAPVLFRGLTDRGAPVIGAAHAGWGGALSGVLENTVKQMISAGVKLETLRASIGPCIAPQSYEVSGDFKSPFLAQDPANDRFFRPGRQAGHMTFNLPAYCVHRLSKVGVTRVGWKGLDTAFNEEDYFSYRRSVHRAEPDYGRQISAVMIS